MIKMAGGLMSSSLDSGWFRCALAHRNNSEVQSEGIERTGKPALMLTIR